MSRSPQKNHTIHRHKRSINKKEAAKKSENVILMDEYLNYVNHLCNPKNHLHENVGQLLDKSQEHKQKEIDRNKQYHKSNSKITQNENFENKHIFKQILEKGLDNNDCKEIFVLTDEIEDNDPEKYPYDRKIEILLTKLMDDKNFINDKTFGNNINDIMLNKIYIALSPDAKKLILDDDRAANKEIQSFFHHLIGFNYEKYGENPEITNEILTYLNNNLITINELCNQTEKPQVEDEIPINYTATPTVEAEDYEIDKLVFEIDKRAVLGKEYNTINQIVKVEEFTYEITRPNLEVDVPVIFKEKEIINNINQFDDIIDVFKSREIGDENFDDPKSNDLNPSDLKLLNRSDANEEGDSRNLNESRRYDLIKKYHRGSIIRNVSDNNIMDNSRSNISPEQPPQKPENPKHKKINSIGGNPFIKNLEADVNIVDNSRNKKPFNKEFNNIFKSKNVHVAKPIAPFDNFKDKRRLIQIDNKKPKFTTFDDEDLDW